ncbi:MAG: putative Type pilus assembly protein PilP [Nitrospirae bacterium]|nr:putative Type pilus assembly protein PilP [Nitrospirota bacterium]
MRHQKRLRQLNRLSKRFAAVLALLLLATAGLTGCSDKTKPTATAPAPAQQPKSAATATVEQAKAEEKPAAIYAYNPAGRRDPFTPIIIKEEKKSMAGAKAPLERYAISEFKLAGIVWGGLGYHAMLEGPDGKGYFVRVGTKVGPNQGVVKKITQNTMVIEEKFKDPQGETNRKEIVIELRKKQEGTP